MQIRQLFETRDTHPTIFQDRHTLMVYLVLCVDSNYSSKVHITMLA